MGHNQPVLDPAITERGLALGDAAGLDWSQSETLAHAHAADSLYLIQGPPGTGMTKVLAQLAEALADDGEGVLVTAFTHRAINNAPNMLGRVAPVLEPWQEPSFVGTRPAGMSVPQTLFIQRRDLAASSWLGRRASTVMRARGARPVFTAEAPE
jgi:hypothetical protein